MHIGAGEWNGEQAQCINGSSQSGNITSAASSAAAAGLTAASYGTLCATALGAPLVSCNWTGAPGFTNPTLWVEGNGTIMTGGNSNYSLALSRGANCSNFACASWSVPAEVTPGRTGEDPWIWQVGASEYAECAQAGVLFQGGDAAFLHACRTPWGTGTPSFTTVRA